MNRLSHEHYSTFCWLFIYCGLNLLMYGKVVDFYEDGDDNLFQ